MSLQIYNILQTVESYNRIKLTFKYIWNHTKYIS